MGGVHAAVQRQRVEASPDKAVAGHPKQGADEGHSPHRGAGVCSGGVLFLCIRPMACKPSFEASSLFCSYGTLQNAASSRCVYANTTCFMRQSDESIAWNVAPP
jgi:hypothetical protein